MCIRDRSSDGDSSENRGQHDNWLIRTDSSGLIIWEKSFGFSGHDHAYNIIETSNGGLLFNGFLVAFFGFSWVSNQELFLYFFPLDI